MRFLLSTLICIGLWSCGNNDSSNQVEPEHAKKTIVNQKTNSPDIVLADTAYCDSIIKQLTGIEKHTVKQDYNLLQALLEYKKQNNAAQKVKEVVTKIEDQFNPFAIKKLDVKNGYIEYMPLYAEVTYSKTYWKLKEGGHLICTEEMGCGPVCSSHLSFEKYSNGIYTNLPTETIIPEIEALPNLLVPTNEFDDPLEFKFVLPQKGKDILFCLDDECITLKWTEEHFKIENN